MSRVHRPLGRIFIATLLFGLTCLVTGCGEDTTVVETPQMRSHLEEVTKNYAKDYAAKYSRKGAAKKK